MYEEYNEESKDDLIINIKDLIEEYNEAMNLFISDVDMNYEVGGSVVLNSNNPQDVISMGDLEAESSPVYKEIEGEIDPEIHLIERLFYDEVEVVVYSGYKYQTVFDEYLVSYDDLSIETLKEIKELIEIGIEYF